MFVYRVTKGADEEMLPPGGHRIEYRLEKDVHQVYRGIQRMLSAYKDEKRGPTYIAVQSPHGMNISLPILAYISCFCRRLLTFHFFSPKDEGWKRNFES